MANRLASCLQLILVTAREWKSTDGLLRTYERMNSQARFEFTGRAYEVRLGRAGMGWGRGLVDFPIESRSPANPKIEGDDKAPAGLFELGPVFGYSERLEGCKMPYVFSSENVVCVDDPKSKFYNQIVDRRGCAPDWTSAENLFRSDHLYKLGIFVRHNVDPVVAGAGSCIFFHLWSHEKKATAGCTTMSKDSLISLIRWLEPEKSPLLLQIPEPELDDSFERSRSAFGSSNSRATPHYLDPQRHFGETI